jgi:hypothetical protein
VLVPDLGGSWWTCGQSSESGESGLSTLTGDAGETGDAETGDAETGDAETGDAETGDAETGDAEAGDAETGDAETGDAETGDAETGDAETGDAETGDAEAGDAEAGDMAEVAELPLVASLASAASSAVARMVPVASWPGMTEALAAGFSMTPGPTDCGCPARLPASTAAPAPRARLPLITSHFRFSFINCSSARGPWGRTLRPWPGHIVGRRDESRRRRP